MAWKFNKQWAYSITYDEGLRDLLIYAQQVNRDFGIPGHVSVVASQVGQARNVPGSSYDGMLTLSAEEIHVLMREGWGVSCHSMSHTSITDGNSEYEVGRSRNVLAEKLDVDISDIPIFCVPGDTKSYPASRRAAVKAGYSAVMTVYDDINLPDGDLLRLCRCPLHSEYPPPFHSAFDPYKRIHQAMEAGGWIIDFCHCPMPKEPVHPWKDCTIEQLKRRFDAIRRIGGDDVWIAEPNDVVGHLVTQQEKASGLRI